LIDTDTSLLHTIKKSLGCLAVGGSECIDGSGRVRKQNENYLHWVDYLLINLAIL
jgi:hypothetical protein